jgi:hypothetical protein
MFQLNFFMLINVIWDDIWSDTTSEVFGIILNQCREDHLIWKILSEDY